MKFEELESAWDTQQVPQPTAEAVDATRRALLPEHRQRGRMLTYALLCLILGLFLNPLLFLANLDHVDPATLPYRWINLLLVEVVTGSLLIYVLRQRQRHRRLALRQGSELQAVIAAAAAAIEAEMADFRKMIWLIPLTLLPALLSIYLNHPITDNGWGPVLLRLGLIAALVVPMSLVCWRHYRRNLRPEQTRLRTMLAEWQ